MVATFACHGRPFNFEAFCSNGIDQRIRRDSYDPYRAYRAAQQFRMGIKRR